METLETRLRRAERRRGTVRLTAGIRSRLAAYAADGDPAHIDGAHVDAEMAALAALLRNAARGRAFSAQIAGLLFGEASRLKAIRALADLRWARHNAQDIGGGSRGADYYTAAGLYAVLFCVNRDAVPEELHEVLVTAQAHRGTGPSGWERQATKALRDGWDAGDPARLDAAVTLAAMAAAMQPKSRQRDRLGAFANNIQAHRLEIVRVPRHEIDIAILTQRALIIHADSPAVRELREITLVQLLFGRFDRFGGMPELDEALALLARMSETVTDTALRPMLLSMRGSCLLKHFEVGGEHGELDLAVTLCDLAVKATTPQDTNRAAYLSNLANALAARYQRDDNVADLNEGVKAAEQAVATSKGAVQQALHQSNLGHFRLLRYARTGNSEDIVAVIRDGERFLETAVGVTRSYVLTTHCAALQARYRSHGDPEDLHRAVELAREAVELIPAGAHHAAVALVNLTGALLARHEALGMADDISEALAVSLEATSAARTQYQRFIAFTHTGWALTRRGSGEDIARAVEQDTLALAATVPGSPDRVMALGNLCLAYSLQYGSTDDLADLDRAIEAGEEAIAIDPSPAVVRGTVLGSLVLAYYARWTATGSRSDLDRAVQVSDEAVRVTSQSRPEWIRRVLGAAEAIMARFDLDRDPSDRQHAVALLRAAMTCPTAAASLRVDAARACGAITATAGLWQEAADAYRQAVELLPLVAMRGIERAEGERLVTEWPGLAGDAAACAINAGDPVAALEVLEHGRAVLWSQRLDADSDLSRLRAVRPELAAELAAVRAELNHTGSERAGLGRGPSHDVPAVDRLIQLGRRWDQLVARIRMIEGFESFLVPESGQAILAGLPAVPVVMLNVSRWRCDALVVRDGAVTVIGPLPCTRDDIFDQANAYLNAYTEFEPWWFRRAERMKLDSAVQRTLDWLWEAVASPVLGGLGLDRRPLPGEPWPRVWWCPSGPLAFLPIHAAGHMRGEGVLDRVVSTYTPTLRALARSARSRAGGDRLLVVAVGDVAGEDLLDGVDAEIEQLRKLIPAPNLRVLRDEDATRQAVTEELPRHRYVHVSCHGAQDLTNPSHACIRVHDGPLTLAELSEAHRGGELITLSACMTATGGAAAADEVVSLAAALHYTGWQQVIATLWWVWDDSAADIMTAVYRRIARDGTITPEHAAQALHDAVREHRDARTHREEPSRWVSFIHMGLGSTAAR
ncbi:CHAT domain-containing protein [Catellatospora citrea]|uniref:CHAT domain-containing protein n=1 Tax=Catellatospora citrea TaxID=53366 RepID=UPI0033DB216C